MASWEFPIQAPSKNPKKEQDNESDFFLSAALNDRILNFWGLDTNNVNETSTSSVASFTLNDAPLFTDVLAMSSKSSSSSSDKQRHVLVSAITNKGQLSLFTHSLSAEAAAVKLKKPIKALNQIKVETKDSSAPLRIYGAFIANSQHVRVSSLELKSDDDVSPQNDLSKLLSDYYLYIVYGSSLNPKIEKLQFSDLNESKLTLKRDDPFKTSVTLQTQTTKIETPAVAKELKVLVPGYAAPQTNSQLGNKRKSTEPSQMTLEERLNVLGIEANDGETNGDMYFANGGQVPKTDNLLVLLVQGLQSNDAKMLNHVLQHKNDKVINKTVRLLPSQYIITLVKELNKRLQGHAQSGLGIIKWLKSVLMTHTSYLMSYPDLIESLGSVYEMMNARTKLFPQLAKLQGKLQLVMSQVSSQAEGVQSNAEKDAQPLLYYQDSTSEDEQIEDELIPSHSEYEEYRFSDDDDDEQEEEDSNADEEMAEEDVVEHKKETLSFKKGKNISKSSLVKKKDEDDDDDEDGDSDDDEDDKKNGFYSDNDDEEDDDEEETDN